MNRRARTDSYSARRLTGRLVCGACLFAWLVTAGCFVPIGSAPEERARRTNSRPRAGAAAATKVSSPPDALEVGTERITAEDVWNHVRAEELADADTRSPDEFRAYVQRASLEWIMNKIAESLLYQRAAARLGPETDGAIDNIVDAEIRKLVTREHDGVQWRFEQSLAAERRTVDDVRARLRREILIARFLETQIKPKVVPPTREELLALYRAREQTAETSERRNMSLIDVRIRRFLDPGITEPTREQWEAARQAARSRIESARHDLAAGVDFAEAARRYSHGLHAEEGGRWGRVSRGSVRERFVPAVQALFTLNEGQISEVIETPDGFFLVRCDAIEPARKADFESVQPELEAEHFRAAYNRLISELLDELREQVRLQPEDLERLHAAVVRLATDDFAARPADAAG